jgi:putative ABC transport system permease protein
MALPISYNWKNLFVRKTTTLLTCLVIGVVVGVFAWMLGFRSALVRSLSFANDRSKLIVLKQGATSETNSAIQPEEFNRLAQVQEIAVDPEVGRLLSPEMLVQVSLPRRSDGGRTFANVAVRGVTEQAFKVHRNVRPLDGATLTSGQMEVLVGVQASRQFGGLEIGQTLRLGYAGNREYRIVGFFSADGGPMESEIWGPLTTLMNSYNRTLYSSVNLRLDAQTEPDYWFEQSRNIRIYLTIVGTLVGIMSAAAVFSIANTMFAAVAGRSREFAMLRTIGFSRGQILTSVVIEAVFLSMLGGVLGCLGCEAWLRTVGNTKDMFGQSTFTTMGFQITLGWQVVVTALALVGGVAVLGSLFPAYRASRIGVVEALREP